MLAVPLNRGRSPKLKRQTPVEDELEGQQNHSSKSILADFESNSSRSLSPHWHFVADPESSSSYLDVPDTSTNSRRSSNNSVVRFSTRDNPDQCSILDLTCEAENLEKAIINNDKYTVRRIIDLHQNKFSMIKDRSNSIFPSHPLLTVQPNHTGSFGSPSITSNTDLLEAASKQALASNDTDEPLSVSSPEPTISMFDAASSILTYTTGPLSVALINHHHQSIHPNATSNSSSFHLALSTHERTETEHESMFTAPSSFYRENSSYPISESPNESFPIFRNVLHVAIMYDTQDVMRICLKYGIDPNAPGRHPNPTTVSYHSNLNAQSSNSTYLSADLPSASSCRNGTLDYNSYYTTERLFTLPPLFLAAQRNNHYACLLLLKFGANVNVQDEQQCTPFHLAARLQHNVCEILISHHASITAKNKYGDTPLSLWPRVKQLQTDFVEHEFRKLCRKQSSNSRHYRFLSRDNDQSPTSLSLINAYYNQNSTTSNGLKNLRRVFRHSRSDSADSKSFKKSLSSQSSTGKSRWFAGLSNQTSNPSNSIGRSESRQMSEERDEVEGIYSGISSHLKKKIGNSSIAANILHAHRSFRQQPSGTTATTTTGTTIHTASAVPSNATATGTTTTATTTVNPMTSSNATAAPSSSEINALNNHLYKRFSELSRLATNIECIDQLMDLLRISNSMDEILTLISQATSPQVHARLAELLHTLLHTSYQEFLRNQDKRDHVENFQSHTKKLLDIALELLSSDMVNMQYIALITINRLYDIYVYHNLINPGRYHACYIPVSRRQLHFQSPLNDESKEKISPEQNSKSSRLTNLFRRFSRENDEKRFSTRPTSSNGSLTSTNRDGPKRWMPLYNTDPAANNSFPSSASSATLVPGGKETSTDSNHSPEKKSNLINASSSTSPTDLSNPIFTYEPFSMLYQIEPGHFLRLMRTRLDAHRKEFHNRPKCVPSTRSPLCTHHCVLILAARILTILCQDHTFQLKLIESKENLSIILDMLNINNDPHLICLVLQTLGILALNPDSHQILTQADIPDSVLHLILPADEMFYTNQTTKFARYVKHLGARILVYMGLLTKVSNKVNLFDILDVEPDTLDCEKPQSFENNFVHHMAVGDTVVGTLWQSFAGICIEKLLDELLKNVINQKKSISKESQEAIQPPLCPSNDNLLYNLSYLSAVIHPVIILRLLEHRLFTPLFKKKSVTKTSSTVSSANDHRPTTLILNPTMGASALGCVPTLPPLDSSIQKRNSFGKTSQSSLEKNRKISKDLPSGSNNVGSFNSTSDLSNIPSNSKDLTSFLSSSSNANVNPTTRKWFWRNSEKNHPLNPTNERNPLLQTINENPSQPSFNGNVISGNATVNGTNSSGAGEMKSLEKELLNLPTFQLSDSQNPLLPSPTSLNYEFSSQFETNSRSNSFLFPSTPRRSVAEDEELKGLTVIENPNATGMAHLSVLHVPFVSVRTPSDESPRSSSFTSHRTSTRLSTDETSQILSHRSSETKPLKSYFFRSSKTLENMYKGFTNETNRPSLRPQISHSQPSVTENHWKISPLLPLKKGEELDLPKENENIHRSYSCAEGISTCPASLDPPSVTAPVTTQCLQATTSEVLSLRSSDSAASSLSAHLRSQAALNLHSSQGNITKSQESLFSFSSPVRKQRSFKSLLMSAATKEQAAKPGNDVLFLIASWVLRSPEDFQDHLVQKELKSFFALLESLRSSFRIWTSQIKEILGLQDTDLSIGTENDDGTNENIHQEYLKIQQDIVSGRLLCSKEEAATLAAVQLRLESWPEENLDLDEEDKIHRLHLTMNEPNVYPSTGVTSVLRSLTPSRDSSRFNLRLSAIACCKQLDSTNHRVKKPFLPPNYRHSHEIFKLIKDKQRKLFHLNDYDNPTRLKECYVRLCRNLPGYNAEIYPVKEIHGKRSKRKGHRFLCIRSDKICLIEMKSRVIFREQRIADLEHWITSGHHLSAAINELILEFRNKTKWRLQLNNTADLRAITVYLWKIVNVEGFGMFEKSLLLNPSTQSRSSQNPLMARRMTLLPTSAPIRKSTKNSTQHLTDSYRNSSNHSSKSQLNSIDHIQNLTRLMQNTRNSSFAGLTFNPSDPSQQICFSADLEELKCLFDFPEEVAIRLTEIEHEIFLSIPPLQYLRHLTLDMSNLPSTADGSSQSNKSIRILVQRFQAVGAFIQQLIVSQTSFQERKAMVASIIRCAVTCWYIGNFNSAMQILAGLKIEAFRPLWLTITDEIPGFKFLTDAFNSNEKTAQYCDAVSRALDIPSCKVVPFFGTFLKDLRTILSSVPSIAVLCNRNTQRPIENINDLPNQEHFITRIGVGGLINTRKIELVNMVLKDIAMFHNRHRRQPFYKCCNDFTRPKYSQASITPETREKHSATVCVPLHNDSFDHPPKLRYYRHQSFPCASRSIDDYDQCRITNIAIQVTAENEVSSSTTNPTEEHPPTTSNVIYPYRSSLDIDEPETFYCLNVSFYQPIAQAKHNHEVSLLSMHHIIDFNNLQMLRNGTTLILYDEDTMHTCLVTVRLELDNCTLTWTKPSWDTHRSIENMTSHHPISNEAAHYSILMKRYVLRDVAFVDMDEGFLQLNYVKHIRSGILNCDLLPIIKRYRLNDISNPENCFTIVYGSSISENKTLCFISPKYCSQIWYSSIDKLIVQYRKHRLCSDRRIVWLKNQYLSLYHDHERFQGPTPKSALLTFGASPTNLNAYFSNDRDPLAARKSISVMKSWSNLALRRKTRLDQDRQTSFSTESDTTVTSQRSHSRSTFSLRGKSQTFEGKNKTHHLNPSRAKRPHSNDVKSRSTVLHHSSTQSRSTIPNPLMNKFFTSRHLSPNPSDSSVSARWMIDETSVDFPEFVELFKSFYFHSRRDLKDLFEKFAAIFTNEKQTIGQDLFKNDSLDVSRHLTGLFTRNILDDITDITIQRLYDSIAINAIPCYSIVTKPLPNLLITKDQFRDFLLEHQKEEKTSYEIDQIIYRHEPNRQNRLNKVLSFEGFARYLLDKENYAFINEHTKVNESEMDYSLSYYFIASSHNTYLTGHQLRGESSVEMYREVLLSGCRCIELDCWDGDDGNPVIYHGRTFVSKISFKLVVEVINESAFLTSPYPVILSIENRCSVNQQTRMAQIFVKVFGDKLITKYMFDSDFNEDPLLPSPNQLKYKILIKNKKMTKLQSTTQLSKQKIQLSVNYRNSIYSSPDENDEDDESDDDELMDEENYEQYARRESQRSNSITDSPLYQLKKTLPSPTTNTSNDQEGDDDLRSYRHRRFSIMTGEPRQRLKSSGSIDTHQLLKTNKSNSVITKIPTVLVAKELSDIVIYTQAIKFRGLSSSSASTNFVGTKSIRKVPKKNIQQLVAQPSTTSTESSRSIDQISPCHQVVSLIENKAKKLCKNQGLDMIGHTETQLVRCYPSGFRVDSSNFNPLHLWIYGIQLVATNYQTLDPGQILNLSMFEQNGNCGYVLKPKVFREKDHPQYGRFNPSVIEREGPCSELTLTIISGQYLTQNVSTTSSVYIEIELLGIPIDCVTRKTKPSAKNSLNPIWQETFVFQIFYFDLAFIRFDVHDAGSNHLMSQRVMPLKCLRPGYRHVRLRDASNVPLELATLFIYSKLSETVVIRNIESDLSSSNTPHLFRNRILRRTADPSENSHRESIRPKHKTFEVRVYGKEGRDEEFRPFAVSQYTTVEELIEMIAKSNDFLQVGETINDVILTESSKTWKKKSSSAKQNDIPARILEKHERILEVIDRVGRETVILCKKKTQTPQNLSLSTLMDRNIQNWENCDRTFLVTIHNISSNQKHTTFRTPINSTAIHVITQLMRKIRMNGTPNDYGLVEEIDQSATNRRIPIKRRLLADDEKIYGIQRLWTSTNSKFLLVKKSEYNETNSTKSFTDKSLFRSITRQKSLERESREDPHNEHASKGRMSVASTVPSASPIVRSHHRNSLKKFFSKKS